MWFAYGLKSEKDGWLYIGMSADVERRVKEHNAGYGRSTRSRAPFRLIYVEACASRLEARKREKFLKSGEGREFLKAIPAEKTPLIAGNGRG
jgi:putative endonuclease